MCFQATKHPLENLKLFKNCWTVSSNYKILIRLITTLSILLTTNHYSKCPVTYLRHHFTSKSVHWSSWLIYLIKFWKAHTGKKFTRRPTFAAIVSKIHLSSWPKFRLLLSWGRNERAFCKHGRVLSPFSKICSNCQFTSNSLRTHSICRTQQTHYLSQIYWVETNISHVDPNR